MAEGLSGIDVTYKAGADLSSYQYHFVYLSAANTVTFAAENGRAIGIIQNKPDAAGESALVRIAGQSKLACYGTITQGLMLTSSAQSGYVAHGEAVDGASEWVCAIADEAGTTGDILTVTIRKFDAHASE